MANPAFLGREVPTRTGTSILFCSGATPLAFSGIKLNFSKDKKVLLRERKRHNVRRVTSARSAALSPDSGAGGWGGGNLI